MGKGVCFLVLVVLLFLLSPGIARADELLGHYIFTECIDCCEIFLYGSWDDNIILVRQDGPLWQGTVYYRLETTNCDYYFIAKVKQDVGADLTGVVEGDRGPVNVTVYGEVDLDMLDIWEPGMYEIAYVSLRAHQDKEFLFSAGLELQTDLDNGIVPQELREEFEEHGISLPESATGFRFSVGLELQTDLDNGIVPQELREEFEAHNQSLSAGSWVLVESPGTEWWICKYYGGIYCCGYLIKKEGGGLNIYVPNDLTTGTSGTRWRIDEPPFSLYYYSVRKEGGRLNIYKVFSDVELWRVPVWINYQPPVASFMYSPEKPMAGGRITFNASSSNDSNGEIVSYEWDFGDGNNAEGMQVTHVYNKGGNYTVTLKVTDNDGLNDSTSKNLDLTLKEGDLLLCRSPWSVVPGFWTHVGMYIGNEQVVEALPSGVTITSFSEWSYPKKTCVEALRVTTADDEMRQKAVDFALEQVGKPYDFFLWQKDASGGSWYCSELIWAAYLNASNDQINIEHKPDSFAITPYEIDLDDDTAMIGEHRERIPRRVLIITIKSPVDLNVTDPDGLVIGKQLNEIPDAVYGEDDIDNDGDADDWVGISEPKFGEYLISVIPEPGVLPTDTFTLEVLISDTIFDLANDVEISEIPDEPYVVNFIQGDVNGNCVVNIFDLAAVGLCYGCSSTQECWQNCEQADVKPDDKINIFDLATVGLNYGNSC